jgi:hypothetical protein
MPSGNFFIINTFFWLYRVVKKTSFFLFGGVNRTQRGTLVEILSKKFLTVNQNFSNLIEGDFMPSISNFYGIIIWMFYNDHSPPHFHVEYGEYKAEVTIETLEIIVGELPRRTTAMVLEWASFHREELRENWDLCRRKLQPKKISPLD